MSDVEILEKATQKAIDGGWKWQEIDDTWNVLDKATRDAVIQMMLSGDAYKLFIFNQDFAKALWGEAELRGLDAIIGETDMLTGAERTHYWQYHLQQMVIADNPLKYLGDNI